MNDDVDEQTRSARLAIGAALGAAALTAVIGWWGARLNAGGTRLFADAAPFHGRWRWLEEPGRFVPVFVAALIVVVWPTLSERVSWRWALVGSWITASVWTVSLAASAGWDRIWGPLTSRYEYLPLARRLDELGGPGEFVRTFVERLPDFPTHVRSHPPFPVLALWFLDRLGLDDPTIGWLTLLVSASAAPAAVIAFDRLAGRDLARRALMFAGLAPAAIWMSSADAVFMALGAWSIAALAVAVTSQRPAVWRTAAVLAGLGAGLFAVSSYGAPTLMGPFVALAVWSLWRRQWQPIAVATGVAVVPVAMFAASGFWWFTGFEATRAEYWKGFARLRPYGYYAIANLAVTAASIGPVAVGGLAFVRRNVTWLLVWGAIAGAIVATLSGYSKGEVERIWLPLTPFLGLAAAAVPGGLGARRAWLAAQLALGVGLSLLLGTPW